MSKLSDKTKVVYRKRELVATPDIKCAGCCLNNEEKPGCKWESLHIDDKCVLILAEHFKRGKIQGNHVTAGWQYKD